MAENRKGGEGDGSLGGGGGNSSSSSSTLMIPSVDINKINLVLVPKAENRKGSVDVNKIDLVLVPKAENRKGGEGDGSLGGGGRNSSSSSSTLMIPSVDIDIPAVARGNVQSGWRLGRQMHRVPLELRLMQPQQQHVYNPVTVSIGPYHHDKPHLQQMEEFKCITRDLFLSDTDQNERNRKFFYTTIHEQINEIRNCYVGISSNEYDDAAVSEMMLRDASFIIYYMKANIGEPAAAKHILSNVGLLKTFLVGPDINLLENQIPYWVIKFLMCLRFGEDEWKALIRKHLCDVCFGDLNRQITIPWEEGEGDHQEEEPLHLLEATQRMLVRLEQEFNNVTTSTQILSQILSWTSKISRNYMCSRRWKEKEEIADNKMLSRQFHSVSYLKTKGIHFRQSSRSLKDVRFKSHALYGKLLLPVRFVNTEDKVLFPNLIAFELSPGAKPDFSVFSVTSYINFMKRLIENPKDVKELREQGILFSNLASDEEVVKLFQEIDTMGVHIDFFDKVKMSIKEHCENKSKTWIAELINSKFQSPWTITALLAATVLLILTFLQTLYTIRAA